MDEIRVHHKGPSWIFAIALIACAFGCSRGSTDRVEAARSELKQQIRNLEDVPKFRGYPHIVDCDLPACRRALGMLSGKVDSDFASPVLYCAKIWRSPAPKPGVSDTAGINLNWLESGFDAVGFYLQDANGRQIGETRDALALDGSLKQHLIGTLMRDGGVRIEYKTTPPGHVPSEQDGIGSISLSLNDLSGPIKAGLILKDGTRVAPIDAWVDPRFHVVHRSEGR